MDITLREPTVAGTFYPGTAAELERELRRLIEVREDRHKLLACIAPHAGYVYSGGVAGRLYGHLDVPRKVIVLGPNHTGVGAPIAVAPHERWRTPVGKSVVDTALARKFVDRAYAATFDPQAHLPGTLARGPTPLFARPPPRPRNRADLPRPPAARGLSRPGSGAGTVNPRLQRRYLGLSLHPT